MNSRLFLMRFENFAKTVYGRTHTPDGQSLNLTKSHTPLRPSIRRVKNCADSPDSAQESDSPTPWADSTGVDSETSEGELTVGA